MPPTATLTMSKTTSTGTAGAKKSLRRLLFLKVAVGVACVVGGVVRPFAGTPPLLQLPTPTGSTRTERPSDDTLTLRVQQTLADDPALKPLKLNLLVNVLDGVAVIGGPVPREDLTGKIEAAVNRVDGVKAVRVSVWVPAVAVADPLTRMVGDKVQPRATPSESRPQQRPQVLLSLPGETRATPPERSDPSRVLLAPVVSVSASERPTGARPPGAEPLPYETIPPTKLPTTPVREDTAWAVEPKTTETSSADPLVALKRNARFERLSVETRDGVATIGGRARRHADVWEFADELRKVPGVRRVIVGAVEVR